MLILMTELQLILLLLQPPPSLKEFDEEQFLRIVEGAGPQMTSSVKGNWVPLYKCVIIL